MAQMIYPPLLLLATIQLLMVSAEEEKKCLGKGIKYTMNNNCKYHDWITEFSCTAGRWNWKLICCEGEKNLIDKVKFVALPRNSCEPKDMDSNDPDTKYYYHNNSNVINLDEVNGPMKICRRDNTFFLIRASNHMCDICGNKCSNVSNTRNGDIEIHLQSTDNRTVNIKIKTSNNVRNYSINCISGNTALQFYTEPKSWIEALKTCRGNRSELVHITNRSVWYDVNSLLKKEKTENETVLDNGVWIGLERSIFGCNPKWMWTSGKVVNNTSGNSSFPVDRLNHHCGKVVWIKTFHNYTWLDEDCFKELPFICQRKT
ncbi:uncharacterized protein LOC122983437 isoform X1 [Scomber scombrus]|uniref:Uncharacterized protein LOC122983437 isoform X1 n=1 Tax=Scomber scombrus TaxID=13677 RepID=A0AAV1P8G7_SCOSC